MLAVSFFASRLRADDPPSYRLAHEADEFTDASNALTPRGAVTRFLELTRNRRWLDAADMVKSTARNLPAPDERVRELRAVLDHYLWIEPDALSDRPEGKLDDGLSPQLEEVGRFGTDDGVQHVRLVRLANGPWAFSRETVARIPDWYDTIGSRWIREHLPPVLLHTGWFSLAWWQWIALPLVLVASVVVGRLVGFVLTAVMRAIARRTPHPWDDRLAMRLAAPRNMVFIALFGMAVLPFLELTVRANRLLERGLSALLGTALVWSALRSIDIGADVIRGSAYVTARPVTVGFLPLGTTLAKMLLVVLAFGVLLQWLGLPVASLVASLGIGGVAVALAARTSLENLFSAVTIGIDQPFRVGDFVRIDGLTGTVEAIGLRSTRLRTLDRTVITIPNFQLAQTKIETFAARDRMRFTGKLPLAIETTGAQLDAIVNAVREALGAHELVQANSIGVFVSALSASSIDIDASAYLNTTTDTDFTAARQALLLAAVAAVEAHGARFARPVTEAR